MKKFLAIILSVFTLSTLCACDLDSDKPTKETSNVSEVSKVESSAKETFSLNETAVFNNLKFTATEIKESNGESFFTPESGNVFVGVNFTIENTSDEEQNISSILLFDAYCDDIKCDYSINAACSFDTSLDGSIAPGKKMVGWYAVEVPSDWQSIEMHVSSDWLSNNSAKFVFTK